MAVTTSSTGGYYHEFIDVVEKDLECPICLHPLKEPMQTPCGHLFCSSCLEFVTRSGQATCPLDKRQFPATRAFPDELHKRKVLCLRVKCTFYKAGCEWSGELGRLEDHLKECSHSTINCEYEKMGCQDLVRPQDMVQHIEKNVSRHMQLLLRRVEQLERENARLRAERWTSSHSCSFFWRVSNWKHKVEQAMKNEVIVIFSEPFYTNVPGYKLKLELYPYGDERSKGTHLSLFLRLLQGDYDNVVRWPFEKKCIVTVMSQQSDSRNNDVSKTLNLSQASQDVKDRALQRPELEEQKRSVGFSNFLSMEDLKSGRFILDDCLLIKALVTSPT